MSSEQRYGYGKDLKFSISNKNGELDLSISSSGDLAIIGGDGDDALKIRLESTSQQIRIRILTPLNTLRDEYGNPISIGSELHKLFGQKLTDMSAMLFKSYILSSIYDLPFIESINGIDFIGSKNNTSVQVLIKYTIKDDTQIYFTTINFNEG